MSHEKKNVISFMNMKGGVGKTTLCVNMAACLAHFHYKKVLIIDLDPQLNASQYIINRSDLDELLKNSKTIYSLYKNLIEEDYNSYSESSSKDKLSKFEDIVFEVNENLHILCGDLNLTKVKETDGTIHEELKKYIEVSDLKTLYDFIFIDCPPTQSIYTSSALLCSNYYILPIKPDYLSTIGVKLFKKMIERYNRGRSVQDKINCLGIIINLYSQMNAYQTEKIEEIKEEYKFEYIFNQKVINAPKIGEGSERNKFIYELDSPKPNIEELTREFLKEYRSKVGL